MEPHLLLDSLRPVERLARGVRGAVRYTGRYGRFVKDYVAFRALVRRDHRHDGLRMRWSDRLPCLSDWTATAPFDRHYTYHTAWAARLVAQTRPAEHVDIGSLHYFSTLISAFVPVRYYDFRPASWKLSGLATGAVDICRLPWPSQSIGSLSCMHVVEHVGLGRYGDRLHAAGDLQAMRELKRVLAPRGNLLLVVPVGQPRICYNAHRVYALEQITRAFDDLTLRQFALLPDPKFGDVAILDADADLVARQQYACGCFWWQRPDDDAIPPPEAASEGDQWPTNFPGSS